jgi:hypothetical protein
MTAHTEILSAPRPLGAGARGLVGAVFCGCSPQRIFHARRMVGTTAETLMESAHLDFGSGLDGLLYHDFVSFTAALNFALWRFKV